MLAHRSDFDGFIIEEGTFNDYIERKRIVGLEWGAASKFFNSTLSCILLEA